MDAEPLTKNTVNTDRTPTELVELLVKFINLDIFPYIPEHGSVGASGDLVQLAHIALTLIGEGEVFYQGQLQPTAQVLEKNHLKPRDSRGEWLDSIPSPYP